MSFPEEGGPEDDQARRLVCHWLNRCTDHPTRATHMGISNHSLMRDLPTMAELQAAVLPVTYADAKEKKVGKTTGKRVVSLSLQQNQHHSIDPAIFYNYLKLILLLAVVCNRSVFASRLHMLASSVTDASPHDVLHILFQCFDRYADC